MANKIIVFFQKHVYFFILILLSLFLFQTNGVKTSPDSTQYITSALQIFNGKGYVDINDNPIIYRGPVFPGLIAICFWIFGVSIKHALCVSRFYFFLNIFLVYGISCKQFDKHIGFGLSLLILTSLTIYLPSTQLLLDQLMPFFIISYIFFLYLAFERMKILYFSLSAVIFTCAFLTKEVSLLFVPLPIVMLVIEKKFRTRRNTFGIFIFYFLCFVLPLPWFVHVYTVTDSFLLCLGTSWNSIFQSDTSSFISPILNVNSGQGLNIFHVIENLIKRINDFWKIYIASNFYLSFFFVFSLVFATLHGFFQRNAFIKMLFTALCLYLPVMIIHVTGHNTMRNGQYIFVFLILYLCLGYTVFQVTTSNLLKNILHKLKVPNLSALFVSLLFVFLITFQIKNEVYGKEGHNILNVWSDKKYTGLQVLNPNKGFEKIGWYNSLVEDASLWISKNLPENSNVLSDWYWLKSLFYFCNQKCQKKYTFFEIPLLGFPKIKRFDYFRDPNEIYYSFNQRPQFIWPRLNWEHTFQVLAFRENDLLHKIKTCNIDYIISTDRRNFLSLYLKENTSFIKIKDFGKIKIYKIKQSVSHIQVNNKKLWIGSRTATLLSTLKQYVPGLYQNLTENFFQKKLCLEKIEIEKLTKGLFNNFSLFTSYDPITAIPNSFKADKSDLLKTESLFEQESLNPNFYFDQKVLYANESTRHLIEDLSGYAFKEIFSFILDKYEIDVFIALHEYKNLYDQFLFLELIDHDYQLNQKKYIHYTINRNVSNDFDNNKLYSMELYKSILGYYPLFFRKILHLDYKKILKDINITGISSDGRNFWISESISNSIFCIDSNSGAVCSELSSPVSNSTGLAWDGNQLWMNDLDGKRFIQFDTQHGNITHTLSNPAQHPSGLDFHDNYLWCVNTVRFDQHDFNIYKIPIRNMKTKKFETIVCPPMSRGIAINNQSLLINRYWRGVVFPLAKDNQQPVRIRQHIQFYHPFFKLENITFHKDRLWGYDTRSQALIGFENQFHTDSLETFH